MRRTRVGLVLGVAAVAGLMGCAGGDDGDDGSSGSTSWTAGTFAPASNFVAQCASPRTGTDPVTGRAYPDKAGSRTTENNWLRSWSHDLYLWYREMPDRDPSAYSTPDYFNLLKTSATTPSGNPKDKFHFTYPTTEWVALSQSGVEAGYGANWVVVSSVPPRLVVVAYIEPGTPAAAAGLSAAPRCYGRRGRHGERQRHQQREHRERGPLSLRGRRFPHVLHPRRRRGRARTVTMVAANVDAYPVQNV